MKAGPEPPTWNGQLFVGPYDLAPGKSQTGFVIESDQPPDSTSIFLAQGFDTLPRGAHSPNPPPRNRTLLEEGWVGPAIVPRLGRGSGPDRSPREAIIDSLIKERFNQQTKAKAGGNGLH